MSPDEDDESSEEDDESSDGSRGADGDLPSVVEGELEARGFLARLDDSS